MTELAQWKEFRAKLVKARKFELAEIGKFKSPSTAVGAACHKYDLPIPKDYLKWRGKLKMPDYRSSVAALWANSIANADREIKRLEASK